MAFAPKKAKRKKRAVQADPTSKDKKSMSARAASKRRKRDTRGRFS